MTNRDHTRITTSSTPWPRSRQAVVLGLLVLWISVAYLIGSMALLSTDAPSFLQPIAVSALVPTALFLATYGFSERFRRFVLSQDLEFLTGLQHWRVVGFAFLLLYAFDALPGLFAWAAGTGDVLMGLTAPLVVARLRRNPLFARSRRFIAYHVLGLLDFAAAVATAALTSGAFPMLHAGPITSAPMEIWPLNIFPSFIVPFFIILHLMVFLKVGALRRSERRHVHGQPAVAA